MPRLLFEKTGNAVWISHLDLMRVFQRAFKRAGLLLKHTQGFNPRPSVSIALPLSVGVESVCELLDFELEGEQVSCDEICSRLNEVLVSGVKVHTVYNTGKKIRDLAFLRCSITMEYDNGVPHGAAEAVKALFAQDTLIVQKKTKNGIQDQDIIPMIRYLNVAEESDSLRLDAVVCCQNPTLNPMQLPLAISVYLPDYTPDFVRCRRIEVLDKDENIFR